MSKQKIMKLTTEFPFVGKVVNAHLTQKLAFVVKVSNSLKRQPKTVDAPRGRQMVMVNLLITVYFVYTMQWLNIYLSSYANKPTLHFVIDRCYYFPDKVLHSWS